MDNNFWRKVGEMLMEFLVFFHKFGFTMISDGVWDCKHNRIPFGIFTIALAIVLIAAAVATDLFIIYEICHACKRISRKIRIKDVRSKKVIGKVTGKEFTAERITYSWGNKIFMPIHHPEEYNVYVEYQEISGKLNSKELYQKYQKGSDIELVLVEKYDKYDNIIESTLGLPE